MSLLDLWKPPAVSPKEGRKVRLANMNAPLEREPKPKAELNSRERQRRRRILDRIERIRKELSSLEREANSWTT